MADKVAMLFMYKWVKTT